MHSTLLRDCRLRKRTWRRLEKKVTHVTTNFSLDVAKGGNSTSVFIDITKCLLRILRITDSTYFSNVVIPDFTDLCGRSSAVGTKSVDYSMGITPTGSL